MSLASAYDVRGSIAGLEELRQEEVAVVHEMGHTIFSERLAAAIRRASTTQNQSFNFNIFIADLPATPYMLHGVTVFSNNAARLTEIAVFARDPNADREIPIWLWDDPNIHSQRMEDDGGGIGAEDILDPDPAFTKFPLLMVGNGQPTQQIVNTLVMRGSTTAFGAGSVTVTFLVHISFAHVGQGSLNSFGIPIPSW